MPKFIIKAELHAEVEVSIEAETAEEAKQLFDDTISISVKLIEMPDDHDWAVYDDVIMDHTISDVEQEPA